MTIVPSFQDSPSSGVGFSASLAGIHFRMSRTRPATKPSGYTSISRSPGNGAPVIASVSIDACAAMTSFLSGSSTNPPQPSHRRVSINSRLRTSRRDLCAGVSSRVAGTEASRIAFQPGAMGAAFSRAARAVTTRRSSGVMMNTPAAISAPTATTPMRKSISVRALRKSGTAGDSSQKCGNLESANCTARSVVLQSCTSELDPYRVGRRRSPLIL